MDKTTFMGNFDAINTVGISLQEAMQIALQAEETRDFKSEWNGITIGLSTGTSGKRGIFLVSEKERAQWVAAVLHRVIKPVFFRKQKVAFFLRANSNLYASVQSALFEFHYFDIFKPTSQLLSDLDRFRPDVLAAQPSVLMDMARALQQGTISIRPFMVISFAEVLHEDDRRVIEQIFGCKIREVYQCTEGFLGVSCEKGTMHLNEDFVHIQPEWIDAVHFYPIITDFTRSSQPIVRYRMNDVLRIKEDGCSCGSMHVAIEQIIGRDDDVLLIDGKHIYPDLIARRIARCTDAFHRYCITQTGPKRVQIDLDVPPDMREKVRQDFRDTLNQLFTEMGSMDVELIFTDKVSIEHGQKHRKIRRIFHEDQNRSY